MKITKWGAFNFDIQRLKIKVYSRKQEYILFDYTFKKNLEILT